MSSLGCEQKKSPLLRAGLRLTKTKITLLIWKQPWRAAGEIPNWVRDVSRTIVIMLVTQPQLV